MPRPHGMVLRSRNAPPAVFLNTGVRVANLLELTHEKTCFLTSEKLSLIGAHVIGVLNYLDHALASIPLERALLEILPQLR